MNNNKYTIIMRHRYPQFSNLKEQNIADRRRAIVTKKLLTETKIVEVKNEVAETISVDQIDIIPTKGDISNELVNDRESAGSIGMGGLKDIIEFENVDLETRPTIHKFYPAQKIHSAVSAPKER
uniref:Uncharacterized protein n=1 Tax=Glossina austeni TaxID=7395 RepID=A0A1A9USJ2_GLOAU